MQNQFLPLGHNWGGHNWGHPLKHSNGNQIAFALVTKLGNLTDIHIHVVNVDGTGFRKLSNDPGQNVCPKWSPDGSCILFYHQPHPNVGKIPHLVRIAMDSGIQSTLDVGESGGYFPDFRPLPKTLQ